MTGTIRSIFSDLGTGPPSPVSDFPQITEP